MTKLYNCVFQKERRKDLRANSAKPEKVVWSKLRNKRFLSLKFKRQYGIGNYIVDFCCPSLRLIIEIDGSIHGEGEEPIKDFIRERFLRSKGFHVKRYSARYILENIEGFMIDLELYCKELNPDLNYPS